VRSNVSVRFQSKSGTFEEKIFTVLVGLKNEEGKRIDRARIREYL